VPKTDTEATGHRVEGRRHPAEGHPSATADGGLHEDQIEKSAAGATVQTTEGEMFSIERRGAETKVLVADAKLGHRRDLPADGHRNATGAGLSKLPLIGCCSSRVDEQHPDGTDDLPDARIVNTPGTATLDAR